MKLLKERQLRENAKTGGTSWIVTYADLVTLVLVFFILLFSISQVDSTKLEEAVQSFKTASTTSMQTKEIASSDGVLEGGRAVIDPLDELLKKVKLYLQENGLDGQIQASRDERGVVLVLNERVLFHTAEAIVLPEGQDVLRSVGEFLHTIPNFIEVEGHTDVRPISTYRYPSNWELSTARASSVIRFLTNSYDLDPTRFRAVGLGATQPVVTGNDPEQLAQNRRVEIVITPQTELDKTNKETSKAVPNS
ncbi:flagellar motor protein MotB [Bacillaceae bacterium SIJ1]|uniref:flagellar motor protein MotB n=1 Tax=Litoribacterium kuwaitense TaxID=1398745 RepID=UPI0013ECAA91|nr:flagellar motor protein MotB [Litoribacterium kuwaitense]NGP44198.1 flagellar motor protein MotB [Litoribacterium kuwaitense]